MRGTGGLVVGSKHSQAVDAAEVLDDLVEGCLQKIVVGDVGPTRNGAISRFVGTI